MAEVALHSASCFITLTYDDAHLWTPMGRPSLNPTHLQTFHKSLRQAGFKFRYYACGEYGDKTQRPHYHGIYCGLWPSDLQKFGSAHGFPTYTSATIAKYWKKGTHLIEEVTLGSASYVAGYVSKKLRGALAAQEYSDRFPPFLHQSQSLGRDYVSRYLPEVLSGSIAVPNSDGSARLVGVPRPWLNRLQRLADLPAHKNGDYAFHAMQLEILKKSRAANAPKEDPDYYVQHRHELSHELISKARLAQTPRGTL